MQIEEEDSFHQTMSREYIRSIKENTAQLKAENIYLKKELDWATLVMSDLNLKIKDGERKAKFSNGFKNSAGQRNSRMQEQKMEHSIIQ